MGSSSVIDSPGKRNLPGFGRSGIVKGQPEAAGVLVQPETYHAIATGVDVIANAVRPTLGPLPRLVALQGSKHDQPPEFLDDGATIARRIIQIEPRGCDVGAMLIRNALWRMHREVGDGTATLAVMYQTIVREGVRRIVGSGCNAMLLRTGLEQALQVVQEYIRDAARPLTGAQNLAEVARGLCQGNDELAAMLAEILDVVGHEGLIQVEKGNRLSLEREYVEGTYWKLSGWVSRYLITDLQHKRTHFTDVGILVSDLAIKDPGLLVPVLERCAAAGIQRLVVLAREVSDAAIGLLVANNQRDTIKTLAVRTPSVGEAEQAASMEDIAALTGARAYASAAYQSLADFAVDDVGRAESAWATESLFGLFGGKGDPRVIRQLKRTLRKRRDAAQTDLERERLEARLGRLSGGTAILRVGAATETEAAALKETAQRALAGLRHAMRGGVVAGGGAALLAAQAALRAWPCEREEWSAARDILMRALEEPLRAIAENAGAQPDVVVERVKAAPTGSGYDVRRARIVDMRAAGIVDSALVLERALQIAVSGAAQALTTDAIVHHRYPAECLEP